MTRAAISRMTLASPVFISAGISPTAAVVLLYVALMGPTAASARQSVPDRSSGEPAISVLAAPSNEDVLLRWATSTPVAWVLGVMRGYRVERAPEASPDDWTLLTPEPVRPWLPPRYADRQDETLLMIAAETLFGRPGFEESGDESIDGPLRDNEIRRRWIFGMFAADLDSTAAEALGVRFSDSSVTRGTAYRYRVSLGVLPDTVDLEIDVPVLPGLVSVTASNQPTPPAPRGVTLVPGDSRITLRWEPETQADRLSAFDIDRSDDGGKSFSRITANPLTFSDEPGQASADRYWTDSTVVNFKVYHYRVFGRTVFARPTLPATVHGYARDLTPPEAPVLTQGVQVEGATVQLQWTAGTPAPPDFDGFLVGHAVGEEGEIEFDEARVLGPEIRSITDSRARSNVLNYYVVAARDTSGNLAVSLPRYVQLIDSIPPAPPAKVAALADTMGHVRLTWAPGTEPDLFGYRVFRANQADHVFSLLTGDPVSSPSYTDTVQVRTLTRSLFYQVVALDFNQNGSSPTRVQVRLPDVVPPVAPSVTSAIPTAHSVRLTWRPSDSDDVAFHLVTRSSAEDSTWSEVARLGPGATEFEDNGVTAGMMYYYRVLAADSSMNRSPAGVEYPVRPIDSGLRPAIVGLSASYHAETGSVTLSWSHAGLPDDRLFFVVYRGVGDAQPTEFRSAGDAVTWRDASPPPGSTIAYAVQARWRTGAASLLSEAVTVEVPAR